MKNPHLKPLLGIFSILATGASPLVSQAAPGSIALVVSPSWTDVRTESSEPQESGIDSERKLSWGGGLMLDSPVGEALSLGVGALYIDRTFQVGTSSTRLERSVPTIFVPVELKFWIGDVLNVGAGAFAAIRTGKVKDSAILGGGTLASNAGNDHSGFDYGLTASVNALFPVAERTGILVGARYWYGLSDGSKSALYNEKIDDLSLIAGLSFKI